MQRNPHNDRWVQHTHTALKSLNTEIIWHGVLLIDAPDIGGVFTGISLIVLLTVIYISHLSLGKGRSTSRKHAEEVRCAFKSLWTRCDVQHVHSFFYKAGEKQFSTSSAEGKKPTTLSVQYWRPSIGLESVSLQSSCFFCICSTGLTSEPTINIHFFFSRT